MDPGWIAVDWGTSYLRAWAMSKDGEVLEKATSERGMSGLDRSGFEPALLELVEPWLSSGRCCQVVAAGMVGSKQGWIEIPYREVPCHPIGKFAVAPSSDSRIDVRISPGLKQMSPPEVMRGEEVQIAGLLAEQPEFDGFVCVPGTHSKWARVRGGEIRFFQTFLTGELFDLLARESILRFSVATQGWDESAFLEGVGSALEFPEMVSAKLFSIRAESMLRDWDGARARARLSGLLIGWELAGARRYWSQHEVVIIGASELGAAYAIALEAQGRPVGAVSAESASLGGLHVARNVQQEGFDE